MGKGQSKHGECYVVNAHFNPLCQLEENNSIRSVETPRDSQDSGLQLTPDISFTLSEDNKSAINNDASTKCALEVFLPKENITTTVEDKMMDLKDLKLNQEKATNENNQISLECLQNNSSEEKQEFSFVLRNYNNEKSEKDDIEKIVVHSICEALKSSLKLPVSGSHTLKVHLSVSPDSEKETIVQDTVEENVNNEKEEEKPYVNIESPKPKECCQQKNLSSFSSVSNSPARYCELKCCHDSVAKLLHSTPNSKPFVSFSPRTRRSHHVSPKKESRRWMENSEQGVQSGAYMNIPHSPHYSEFREKRYNHRHGRQRSSKDCSHYLDLAHSDMAEAKNKSSENAEHDLRCSNPAFYSPLRNSNKSNASCRTFNQNLEFFDTHAQKKSSVHNKLHESDIHSNILKYKLLREAKNNVLDLSFDLCDTGKPNDELYHHRRSKSYDTNECIFVDSPKSRHRNCTSNNCNKVPYLNTEFPPSPSCHHRHRHREREKDKQRAMQQVANWLEREHLDRTKQKRGDTWKDTEPLDQKDSVIERHEYHHIHEHHHYYHYIES